MSHGGPGPRWTMGNSSVAAEGETKYMGTKAVGGQVDDGESVWKFSSDWSVREEARSLLRE